MRRFRPIDFRRLPLAVVDALEYFPEPVFIDGWVHIYSMEREFIMNRSREWYATDDLTVANLSRYSPPHQLSTSTRAAHP